jgi:CBS domain containing-hemolysin-like protein
MTSSLIVIVVLLAVNGLLAAARAALINASKPRLRQIKDEGRGGAALAARVAEDATLLLATVRLAQTFCRFSVAGLMALLFEPALAGWLRGWGWQASTDGLDLVAFFVLALPATLLIVSVGELLPEAWALNDPEGAALWAAVPVAALEWILRWPVRGLLWFSDKLSVPLAGQRVPFVTEEEIKTLVDAGEEGGVIEEGEKEMIYSVFDFGETVAREIMVPRIDMLGLEVGTSVSEAIEAVVSAGHSRIPVYEETIDNIVGLVYGKDLLRVGRECDPSVALRSLLRPAYFVPESKKVADLLSELQQQRIHMAIVVDEYGGVAGLVTLEDIMEEIVGEIRDEYDINEESLFEQAGEGEYLFNGRINFDEVADLLHLGPVESDSDTLGGFIYAQLGRVPVPGEKVTVASVPGEGDGTPASGPVQFEVLTVAGRRIRKVRARHLPPPAAPASEDKVTHE